MKILRQGVDHNTWTINCDCPHCDSELQAEASDITSLYHSGDYREPSYYSYSVQCPVCKNSISLDKEDLPKLIKVMADKKANSGSYDR